MPPKEANKNEEQGDVPAKGYWQTPQQIYDALRVTWRKFEKEKFDLEAFRKEKPISYFNRDRTRHEYSEYDRLFRLIEKFDPRKKREDRQNLSITRDKIFIEEEQRIFPVVVSHTYGHRRTDLEGKSWLCHKKVEVMKETRRRCYINLKPTKKLPTVCKLESL